MKYSKRIIIIALLLLIHSALATPLFGQTVSITSKWRFIKGDNASYALATFNDAHWQTMPIGIAWERVNNDNYDGYAWYRTKVMIPSSLKKEVAKTKKLTLSLGKIDDADETFFNSKKVGATGKFSSAQESAWNVNRLYNIPMELIIWDKENTIAIRVADFGGGGGLYEGSYFVEAASWKSQTTFELSNKNSNHVFNEGESVSLAVSFNNQDAPVRGSITMLLSTFSDSVIGKMEENFVIEKGEAKKEFNFSTLPIGFYKTKFVFTDVSGSSSSLLQGFAVAPTSAIVEPDQPNDFDAFWSNALKELNAVSPEYKMTLIKGGILDDNKFETFLVEMRSWDNALVKGFFVRPIGGKNLPAVLNVPGYSSEMKAYFGLEQAAVFHFNIRGHGNSKESVNPGFPGYLQYNLDNKEKYIYKGAYLDCVRAIDFLVTQPEINAEKIGAMGGSQGGALSFAVAALDKRVKALAPDVPFLSDFPNYFKIAFWPGNEFKDYVQTTNMSWSTLYHTLSYFDIKNLATKIECPLLMSVGLQDPICPPAINFAAYNNTRSVEKDFVLYPSAGHSVPASHGELKIKWLLSKLQ